MNYWIVIIEREGDKRTGYFSVRAEAMREAKKASQNSDNGVTIISPDGEVVIV
jgi:hypothetical protein